jgi:hypothetical protein
MSIANSGVDGIDTPIPSQLDYIAWRLASYRLQGVEMAGHVYADNNTVEMDLPNRVMRCLEVRG